MAMPISTVNLTTAWLQADAPGVRGQDILLLPSVAIYISNVSGADAAHRAQWPANVPWGVNDLGGDLADEEIWIRTVSGSGDVGIWRRGVNADG